MFERFTERARQVIVLAQEEARALRHSYIGTEHLLLGLLREEQGLAARVLESFDVTADEVRAQIGRIVGPGEAVTSGQIPFTPRAKTVLELSLREALLMAHNSIGTEHILLGVLRENGGVAARILLEFVADPDVIRTEIVQILDPPTTMALRRREPPRKASRQRWEYLTVTWPPSTAERSDALNDFGALGWELAAAIPSGAGSELIFKRPGRPELEEN